MQNQKYRLKNLMLNERQPLWQVCDRVLYLQIEYQELGELLLFCAHLLIVFI
jgi:hypothetical protein